MRKGVEGGGGRRLRRGVKGTGRLGKTRKKGVRRGGRSGGGRGGRGE